MKSKYLIGLIPSFFILMIAHFAKAAPIEGVVEGYNSTLTPEPAVMLLFGIGLVVLAAGIRRIKR